MPVSYRQMSPSLQSCRPQASSGKQMCKKKKRQLLYVMGEKIMPLL